MENDIQQNLKQLEVSVVQSTVQHWHLELNCPYFCELEALFTALHNYS